MFYTLNFYKKIKTVSLSLLTLILVTQIGCSASQPLSKEATMALTSYPKTLCFGRYQINVPSDAYIQGFSDKFDNIDIYSEKVGYKATLEEIVNKRLSELKAQGQDTSRVDKPVIVEHGKGPVANTYYIYYYASDYSKIILDLESYKLINGYLYTLKDRVSTKSKMLGLDSNFSVLKSLVYRDNKAIPNQAGICIDNGFIADPIENKGYGYHRINIRLNSQPAIKISATTYLLQKANDKNLIERIKSGKGNKALKDYAANSISFSYIEHRLNKRVVNGMYGQERGTSVSEDGKRGYERFLWEKPGTVDDSYDPEIRFSVQTDKYNTPRSLTTKEVIHMYDSMVGSIQPRVYKD